MNRSISNNKKIGMQKGFWTICTGQKRVSPTLLIISTSLFFVLFDNFVFFRHVTGVYPVSLNNIGFLFSLVVGLTAILTLFLTLITSRYTIKPTLLILLIISSFSAYFMDNYNVVIDDDMIRSILATDWAETSDLISWKLLYYVLLLAVLPSLVIYRVKLIFPSMMKAVLYKFVVCSTSIVVVLAVVLTFSKFYTSFFRENKPLRYYTNPTYYLYSIGKYAANIFSDQDTTVAELGIDAKVINTLFDDHNRPKLVSLIVGEAARADHFSLNGYEKETTPLLSQENIINFSETYSCGTSTAYSVPCMFSHFNRSDYSPKKGAKNENILDVLTHTGAIDVLWRDNNSDSKDVALRVPYENFRTPTDNTICIDGECRDEGMLVGLDNYIEQHQGKNILVVLHQMGNHGPAYYKRYPEKFEIFKPVCKTNQFEKCTQEEIINAYDNAILYTDYFLSKVIAFLKGYEKSYNTTMLYYSDHGESLGEDGVYLHGLPYALAPDSQTHIASLMWFGRGMTEQIDIKAIRQRKDQPYSHDNLFHTLLGIFQVKTKVYNNELDVVYNPNLQHKSVSHIISAIPNQSASSEQQL